AQAEALTKVGLIGIKVWICRGEIYGKVDLAPQFSNTQSGGRSERPFGGERREDRKGGFRKKRNSNR
ncbi:MAG: 30S ribosomal protein S3, partial [Bacteroidales bacterium]